MVLILKLTYLFLTMEEQEVRTICKSIVAKAKATARVDQGRLKRSIAFTYIRGVVKFRQLYWGSFGDNSLLEQLARDLMPRGIPYSIELTQLGGKVYEKGTTKQGRSTVKRSLTVAKKSAGIKALIALVKKQREDGETENETTT